MPHRQRRRPAIRAASLHDGIRQGFRAWPAGPSHAFEIAERGTFLHPDGLVIGLPGPDVWGDDDAVTALSLMERMIPHATCWIVPVLGQSRVSLASHVPAVPLPIDGRPGFFRTEGVTIPDEATVAVSRSSMTPTSEIALHEVWHMAEHTMLDEPELRAVGAAYGLARDTLGLSGIEVDADPREWAAKAFVAWYKLVNITGAVMPQMHLVHDTFDALASGAMARRAPHPARDHVREWYLDAAVGLGGPGALGG